MTRLAIAGVLAALLLAAAPASARVLTVGAGQEFAVPSQAAAAAADGDTVTINPGTYYDCAVWHNARLTIQGKGADSVITDTTCQGKAIFVLDGDGIIVRDLTLARARVPDGNGAGIRLEAQSLTLQNVRFINNQIGLLAGDAGTGRIRITGCLFEAGGVGGPDALSAILVGHGSLLEVERSTIRNMKGGGISSSAAHTVLNGNTLSTGIGDNPLPPVQITAGSVLLQDNALSVGPVASRRGAAIWVQGAGEKTLRRNRLTNTTGQPAVLLLDWSTGPTTLDGNVVGHGDVETSASGLWLHGAASMAHRSVGWVHAGLGQARGLAGELKRSASTLVGR